MAVASAIKSRVVRITPTEANALLPRFFFNTKVDQRLLQAYTHDMQERRWILNGSPLVLSDEGRVLDGRIRLLACVQSNSAFDTLVVEGIASTSYETIDAVRRRTLADVLSIRQERHGRPLAAALRIVWAYLNATPPGAGKGPSPTSLLELLEVHPVIRDSVLPTLPAMPLLPHGCGIALHYLMSQVDPAKADRFFALLGEPIGEGNLAAIINLRQILAELRGRGGSRKQTYILAITIKAWNAFRSGVTIKLLRFSPDRESFPSITGLGPHAGPLFEHANRRSNSNQDSIDRHLAVKARIGTITPELSDDLLSRNRLNRHVSASVIGKYARDMAAGRWHLNGQTIKISSTGKLLDGQHRLEAAKKAKKPFQTIIVEGLPDDSFSSLDIGHRRSVSDVLRERGESHTVVLASSLRSLWMIRNGVVLAANSSPTNSELLNLLNENKDIRHSLRHVTQIREIMGTGIACALHYLFSLKDQSQADEFFMRLMDGIQLSDANPIYHLRERLIRTRSSHRVRLAEAERVALAIKAWNAFRQGKPMQVLAWRNRGPMRETLPLPI